jgi:AraC family L-rhamnose operon regulatory protein RhaS
MAKLRRESGNTTGRQKTGAQKTASTWLSPVSPHGSTLLPELPSLGRAPFSTLRLERSHGQVGPGLFEIAFLLRGSDEWRIGAGNYRLAANDLFIAGPDRRPTNPIRTAAPGELYWLTLRHDRAAALPGLRRAASNAISAALTDAAGQVLRGSPAIPLLFGRLLDEHRQADSFAPWAARATLHSLLAEVLRAAGGAEQAVERAMPTERIGAILAMVEDRLAEPLTVAELAAAARLGLGQFHQRFLAETGYTPADYRARRRLLKAQEMLAEPALSVTDIALTLGFSTSQYFATFFRRFTGMSPRDYRRRRHAP